MCSSCLPGVEEEIARKDSMARTRALGGALKASSVRGKEKSRTSTEASKRRRSLFFWKVRGLLWFTTLMLSISIHVMGKTKIIFAIAKLTHSFRRLWTESANATKLHSITSHCSSLVLIMDSLGPYIFPSPTISYARQGSWSRRSFEIYCRLSFCNFWMRDLHIV